MEKKKIIKLYSFKELLKKYNSYFDKNKSLVSDQEFDELKREVLTKKRIQLKSDDFQKR